jgi:hypothetical protein
MPRFLRLASAPLVCLVVIFFLLQGKPLQGVYVCGDGVCSPGERFCPEDCGSVCGDGICDSSESNSSCPTDCSPPPSCFVDTCTSCYRPSAGFDSDTDGIPDSLEYDLAHHFYPAALLQNSNVDFWVSYFYNNKATAYTVTPIPPYGICNEVNKCLELRFAIPFLQDFGDQGFGGHLGDSEFYAAVVMRSTDWPTAQGDASQWQLIRDFTPAHEGTLADSSMKAAYGYCAAVSCSRWDNDDIGCSQHYGAGCVRMPGQCLGGSGGPPNYFPCSFFSDQGSCVFSGGNCSWHPQRCLDTVFCYGSSPLAAYNTIHIAEKTHGLYHSDAECDAGNFGFEDCPDFYLVNLRDYKGLLLQNVGNASNNSSFDTVMQHPDLCSAYSVWGSAPFGDSGSTAYKIHFTEGLAWGLNP